MKQFAELYESLDATTKTNEKIAALSKYFSTASSEDAAWATYFLCGYKLRQLVPTKLLRVWAAQQANIPEWLFDESYHAVGDLAETLALIVPAGQISHDDSLSFWIEQRLMPLKKLTEDEQQTAILQIWNDTPKQWRLIVMKLITGAFRVGVSKALVTRAIGEQFGLAADAVSHRLMGDWKPTKEFFDRLTNPDVQDAVDSQPFPFCLAHPIDPDVDPASLGSVNEYAAEWKWDGIRGQLIRLGSQTFIWSRGEELMEGRWPEIESAAKHLPDGTVLDGEILACTHDGHVLPFAQLQRRIARKSVGKKLLADVPVVFHAFDLLENQRVDLRARPFYERREALEQLLADVEHPHLRLTQLIPASSWDDWSRVRDGSRAMNAEGLMIKRRDASYDVGRVRGTWWKWKISPYTIDAVLIYAQKGHGKRASLYTDYTFALWEGDALVPFAKAYSGLDDAEILQVDRFVRAHTREAFGPVRSVEPAIVMELAFEGLQRSTRHKSGIATRFPRIIRWRHDKQPKDANTLEDILRLLPAEGNAEAPNAVDELRS
jgi:DNA ligase 1